MLKNIFFCKNANFSGLFDEQKEVFKKNLTDPTHLKGSAYF